MSIEPDEIHRIDRHAKVDTTGDALVDEWRGVNVEDEEEVTGGLAGLLRSRSRAPESVETAGAAPCPINIWPSASSWR